MNQSEKETKFLPMQYRCSLPGYIVKFENEKKKKRKKKALFANQKDQALEN